MKSVEQSENIQKEALEIVLNEFLEEQKNANKINSDIVSAINQLTNRVAGFNEKLDNVKQVDAGTDTRSLEDILKKAILQIQLTVSTHPKNVTRKFQILLFPEQDAKLFYKIVFGRWFMWLAIMLFFTFLFRYLVYRVDVENKYKTELLKQNGIVNAWNRLYTQNDKQLRRKMDSTLFQGFGPHRIPK